MNISQHIIFRVTRTILGDKKVIWSGPDTSKYYGSFHLNMIEMEYMMPGSNNWLKMDSNIL